MTDDRWNELVAMIEEKCTLEEKKNEPTEDGTGTCETLIFEGPLGTIKLERISRPLKIDTKTQYAKRIGAPVTIENVYSDTEKVHTVKAYRQLGTGEFQEIDTSAL